MQKDTLSPYIFIIFLEPFLRWFEEDDLGYDFNTSPSTCTIIAYADDLAIVTDNIHHIQPQIFKLQKFAELSYIDLDLSKYAITGYPNKFKFKPKTFKTYIQ